MAKAKGGKFKNPKKGNDKQSNYKDKGESVSKFKPMGKNEIFNRGKGKESNDKDKKKQNGNVSKFKSKGKNGKFNRGGKGKKEEEESDFEEVDTDFTAPKNDFYESDEGDEELQENARKLIQQQNRKKKKSGGFQSMGLSHHIFQGVIKKGYKVPTPIQRKTIPLILDGKDVVAMARTGSGKTAAFLVPMFEKLKVHATKTGARALILSPTRELALQTLKFTKELGKFTGLKAAVILGGDSMDEQFAALHENPDIIIATPGRFMHVLVEMNLKLHSVEYLVFDEADRLFEMGFQEQLTEILQRLPESRQTVLFSATLPRLLVDFAKAGLHDPTLIRLDVDTKLSEHLRMSFLYCRAEDKLCVLLNLLRNAIKAQEQTVIFAATKHHVEYLNMILKEAGFDCAYIYSALDQTARKINVAKFRNKKCMTLVVTDVAARGIDIPMLDNVINFNFPAKPKLFVHRVGRVARAGRSGTAYSIVSQHELGHVFDLHLFLGRSMTLATANHSKTDDSLVGRVPQSIIDDEEVNIRKWHENTDIFNMIKVTQNAYNLYQRSCPPASTESIKRAKEIDHTDMAYHPLFGVEDMDAETERLKLLDAMRNFRPNNTIFEINKTNKTSSFEVMKNKRHKHGGVIESKLKRKADGSRVIGQRASNETCDDATLQEALSSVISPKFSGDDTKKKRKLEVKDEENFVSYTPKDFDSERGLELGVGKSSSFDVDANSASMDLAGDDSQQNTRMKNSLKWDRKKKKFTRETGKDLKQKKVKTESGTWVKATYNTSFYKDWLQKSKFGSRDEADDSDGEENPRKRFQVLGSKNRRGKKGFHVTKAKASGPQREMKNADEILKERKKKHKLASFMKYREKKNKKKRH